MKKSLVILLAIICLAEVIHCNDVDTPITIHVQSTIKHVLITLACTPHTTVAQLKNAIYESEGLPSKHQVLVKHPSWTQTIKWIGFSKSLELQDHKTLKDYGLQNDSFLNIHLRLPNSQSRN